MRGWLWAAVIAGAGAFARAEEPATAEAVRNYTLVADDLIEVKVFQEDDLNTRTRVAQDGQITFPLLGSVALGGRTVQEAEELIRSRLQERFLVKPQVNLTVLEYARKLFTVLGQVQRAGTFKFPDRQSLNLLQAIGMAGGFTRIADPSRVLVRRQVDGKEKVLTLDAKRIARDGATADFPIRSGDLITVSERLF